MNVKKQSKHLSWLLRHGAREAGLAMDAAGWAAVHDVLAATGLDRQTLERVVAENNKRRLQLDGQRVRASQGHSVEGTPVTAEALEASWIRLVDRCEPVFHGTRVDVVDAIAQQGLRPMNRTHVHLAAERDATVGKRANVALLLRIDPMAMERAGIGLFQSPNGVVLARWVPPHCIVDLEPLSRRARAMGPALRALLG